MTRMKTIFLPFLFLTAQALLFKPYTQRTDTTTKLYACKQQTANTGLFCPGQLLSAIDKCSCTNANAVATLMACLSLLGSDSEKALKFFYSSCEAEYHLTFEENSHEKYLAYYTQWSINKLEISEYTHDDIVTRPVKLDALLTEKYLQASQILLQNYNNSLYYSLVLVFYWIIVGLLYALNNWCKLLFPYTFVRSKSSRLTNFMKKHITIPAAFGLNKQTEMRLPGPLSGFFKILMPSRVEIIVILGFFAACATFLVVGIKVVPDDPIFLTTERAYAKHVGVRSGIIGTISIPLVILFAGRNNILIWFTGINYATFVTFHKWIARVVVIMILIHACCYTIMYPPSQLYLLKGYYYVGAIIGTSAASFLLFHLLLAIRRKWYDLFLYLHITLVIIFIYGGAVHVRALGYLIFLYCACGIWILDRAVRIGRIFAFGFPKAKFELINSDTVRLQIPTTSWWCPTKGGFAFVYFVETKKFFQSHPFSYVQLPNQINFYIKVKDGVTSDIKEKLIANSNFMEMKVTVEGPYSGMLESCNIKHYHSAVFMAGGNGIPSMFSEAYQLALIKRQHILRQRIKLIWVIRDYTFLNWFYEELMLLRAVKVDVDIYVTRPDAKLRGRVEEMDERKLEDWEHSIYEKCDYGESSSELNSIDINTKKSHSITERTQDLDSDYNLVLRKIQRNLNHITFYHGRPRIPDIVSSEIALCDGTSIAYVACGHPQMVDEMRRAVSKTVDCGKRVDFYEHLQVWA